MALIRLLPRVKQAEALGQNDAMPVARKIAPIRQTDKRIMMQRNGNASG